MLHRLILPLVSLLLTTACADAHQAGAASAPSLVPFATVELSYGLPLRMVSTSDGFSVVTGWWIPDGHVPMLAWDIGPDGRAASNELDFDCLDEWSLHATPRPRLVCRVRSGDDYALAHTTLSPGGVLGDLVGPFDSPGRVDDVALHGDAVWVVDRWPTDPTTSLVVTEHALDSGRARRSVEQPYDWMLQRPAIGPGTLGPGRATITSEPDEGPVLTIRRLGAPLTWSWPTCVASHGRDALGLMEWSEDEVVTLEACDGAMVVSIRDVASGEVRSRELGPPSTGSWGGTALARAGGRIVVAYGTPPPDGAQVLILDDALALRARGEVAGIFDAMAVRGDVVAVLTRELGARVTLLREEGRL